MAETKRAYNFGTIIYSESAPEDWQEKIEQWKVPVIVSPVHDKDLNNNGSLKKPHRHLVVMFSSLKSKKQVQELFEEIQGVGVEVVLHLPSYIAYLTHKNALDKAQYDEKDILCFGGADYKSMIAECADKYKVLSEIFDMCKNESIYNYAVLVERCRERGDEYFRTVIDKSYAIREYIRARSWQRNAVNLQYAEPLAVRAGVDSVKRA